VAKEPVPVVLYCPLPYLDEGIKRKLEKKSEEETEPNVLPENKIKIKSSSRSYDLQNILRLWKE
jgi:hypothetical protein